MVSDTKGTSAIKLKNPAALQSCFHPVTGCYILILFFFFSLYLDIQLKSMPISETNKISGQEVKHLLRGFTTEPTIGDTLGKENVLLCTKWNTDWCWRRLPSSNTTLLKQLQESSPNYSSPFWLIQGETEIASNSTAGSSKRTEGNTYKSRGVVVPHGFGISKSWRKRKANATSESISKNKISKC